MKKMYILSLALVCTLTLAAQTKEKAKKATKTTKTAKATKTVKPVVAEAAVSTPATITTAAVVDEHAGHNHGAGVTHATPAVEAPKGEDNLQIEGTHDFGKIAQGKPVTFDFVFKNNGKSELKLDNVQAGCGCTTPTWQPGPYKAGETAKINVGYNAAAVGAFTKPVTITYNGGLTKVINITGEVIAAPPAPAPENKTTGILKQGN
jgi:hypothetical protein